MYTLFHVYLFILILFFSTLGEGPLISLVRGCASINRKICTHKNWNINTYIPITPIPPIPFYIPNIFQGKYVHIRIGI